MKLKEKIAIAQKALDNLYEATSDPEVRAAICHSFYDDFDEVFYTSAEKAAYNYSDNEPVELQCAVFLPNLCVYWVGDDQTDDAKYVYSNAALPTSG
jgi:hypothetical protein